MVAVSTSQTALVFPNPVELAYLAITVLPIANYLVGSCANAKAAKNLALMSQY